MFSHSHTHTHIIYLAVLVLVEWNVAQLWCHYHWNLWMIEYVDALQW